MRLLDTDGSASIERTVEGDARDAQSLGRTAAEQVLAAGGAALLEKLRAQGFGVSRPGKVILVGAGPGAPDLITVRGADALRRADAVVYDALASKALLDLAPPEALRIDVGKRGHDAPTRTQEETTALLLRLAAEGRTVVRLKGGDPYVFGRGGEEASACAEAGIPFEVVPGVSAIFGALAFAGIPITDRRHGASFAVVTGHKDPTKVTRETRWDLLARAADTLVILMGMRNLDRDRRRGCSRRAAAPRRRRRW